MEYQSIIDKYYGRNDMLRRIYMLHCRQVTDKAMAIAHSHGLNIDDDEIQAAAMLHDIGIVFTDAPSIGCHGKEHYLRHGVIGAELLRSEGADEKYARVAERHTGAGITVEEIKSRNLPLPMRDLLPETLLEKLICYADKFFSKSGDMQEKPLEKIRATMAKISQGSLERFDALHQMFK